MVTILEILKYTIPALIVMLTSYFLVKDFLNSDYKRKQLAVFEDNQKIALPLRVQAYERLAIFVERITPQNMIGRLYNSSMTAQDLQIMMVQSIRAEFEHNLSQQVYVSREVWETVKSVKEQEIALINQMGSLLPVGAPAAQLTERILDYVLTSESELPAQIALSLINHEAKLVLTAQA
jgi:hypothetical protein